MSFKLYEYLAGRRLTGSIIFKLDDGKLTEIGVTASLEDELPKLDKVYEARPKAIIPILNKPIKWGLIEHDPENGRTNEIASEWMFTASPEKFAEMLKGKR